MIVFIRPPGGQLCNQVISHKSDHEPLKVHQHKFILMYLITFYRAYFYVKDTFKCDFKLLFYKRTSVLMSYIHSTGTRIKIIRHFARQIKRFIVKKGMQVGYYKKYYVADIGIVV